MKTLMYLLAIFLFVVSSCKKPNINAYTPPNHIYFIIIGKDGKNIIHSVKDSLTVTYVSNGQTITDHLHIYKVEVSATDTTAVSKYNGFVISDRNFALALEGYITDASAGGDLPPVRNFNLYLNSVSLGIVYLDYWGWLSSYPQPSSSTFTFNGVPGVFDYFAGVYNNGDGIASEIEYHTDLPGNNITVLKMQ